MSKKKSCPNCTIEEECDDCFIARMESLFDLNTTIAALENTLNPDNRAKFVVMSLRDKQWIAIQAHGDGLITYGKVTSRKGG